MRTKAKLDQRTVKQIERFLEDMRDELTGAVRRHIARRRAVDDGRASDDAAWAAETLSDEIEVTLMDHRSRQVVQIDAALERLGRGEYGFCRDCGEFIGLPRLRALPFAQRCSGCQAGAERRARSTMAGVPAGAASTQDDDE